MPAILLDKVQLNYVAQVELPGSKSIANRVLLLASIATGTSIIHNVPDGSEDVAIMISALKTLGVSINKIEEPNNLGNANKHIKNTYQIEGCKGNFLNKKATINCGNSGTSIRFLTSALALSNGEYTLTGVSRMKERPIGELVTALNSIGTNIHYLEKIGYPPIKIYPFQDKQLNHMQISSELSSQFLSSILLAIPLLNRKFKITIAGNLISKSYIKTTLKTLSKFGVNYLVENINEGYTLTSPQLISTTNYTIEPDATSASYFLALGALNGKVEISGLSEDSIQPDKEFAKVLLQMGAIVEYTDNSIIVEKSLLHGITVDMENMPDSAMTIAVLALFAKGNTTITGIESWAIKESNRIQAMYNELTKLGAKVNFTEDSITIEPPLKVEPNVTIDTYDDHRIAMCFSLLAAKQIPVIINNYECVKKTFANYFETFKIVTNCSVLYS